MALSNSILPAFAVEIGLITYRSVSGHGPNVVGLPIPSNYLAAGLLFGVLALPQGEAKRPATLAAWAFVMATYFGVMDKLPGSAANLFNGKAGTGKPGKSGSGTGSKPPSSKGVPTGNKGPRGTTSPSGL